MASLSPKQIAVRAIANHYQAFIDSAKKEVDVVAAESGRSTNLTRAIKAREQVDTITASFTTKLEKLLKKKVVKASSSRSTDDGADF